MWEAIKFVGTGLSLVAFIVAIALLVYRSRLQQRVEIIKNAPENERIEAIAATAEFFRVNVDGLPVAEKREIVITQIQMRARRDLVLAGLALTVAILLAAIAITAIRSPGGGTLSSHEQTLLKQNLAQIHQPLAYMSSSEGYSAGNREQWLSLLRGLNFEAGSEMELKIKELIGMISSAPENPGDGFYNVRISNSIGLKFDELRVFIEKQAIAAGIEIPLGRS